VSALADRKVEVDVNQVDWIIGNQGKKRRDGEPPVSTEEEK
jgi:hypothetical protein